MQIPLKFRIQIPYPIPRVASANLYVRGMVCFSMILFLFELNISDHLPNQLFSRFIREDDYNDAESFLNWFRCYHTRCDDRHRILSRLF